MNIIDFIILFIIKLCNRMKMILYKMKIINKMKPFYNRKNKNKMNNMKKMIRKLK